MPTLSSSIVSQDVASMRDVEEALARQSIYGGDLATNLLELATVSEARLTTVLASSYELEPAPVGELPVAPDTVRRLVPRELAHRFALYPLSEHEGNLTVAVSEPLPSELESDLSFSLGVAITQRIAPLVRVRQAIARDYDAPLDRRTLRILAKLEGKPDPSPSSKPPRVHAVREFGAQRPPTVFPPTATNAAISPIASDLAPAESEERAAPGFTPTNSATLDLRHVLPALERERSLTPPSATFAPRSKTPAPPEFTVPEPTPTPPKQVLAEAPTSEKPAERAIEAGAAEQASPPEISARTLTPAPLRSVAATPKTSVPARPSAASLSNLARAESRAPKPRRLGPYTAAMAENDLMQAETRDDILRAFFQFSAQYFEYAALFALHDDLAEGRDAHGSGAPRSRVLAIGVPLELPSVLQRARDATSYELVRLGSGGLDGALAKDLERKAGPQVLLLPVRVRGRSVLVLYGDHGDSDVELSDVGEVISFAPLVSSALEHLIVRRKKGAPARDAVASLPIAGRPVRKREAILPSIEDRAAALASALEASPRTRAIPPPAPLEQNPVELPVTPTPPSAVLSSSADRTQASETPTAGETPTASETPEANQATGISDHAQLEFERANEERAPLWKSPSTPAFKIEEPSPALPPVQLAPRASATKSPDAPPTRVSEPVGSPLDAAIRALGSAHSPSAAARSPFARPVLSVGPAARSLTPRQDSLVPLGSLKPESRRPSSEPPEEGWDIAENEPAKVPNQRPSNFPRSEQRTSPGMGAPHATIDPGNVKERGPVPIRKATLPRLELVPEAQSAPPPPDEAPELSVDDVEELDPTVLEEAGVPLAPASRAAAHSARPLPPREDSQELSLPSVIVDVANDCRELVKRLLDGDVSVIDQLAQIGDPAITLLVGRFPGPITSELRRGVGDGPPKASDCGPVMRALARIGGRAAPFLVVRTADADPAVRAWATRLLGEMPTLESARAIARRFLDEPEVRRAALAAGHLLTASADATAALSYSLSELINDPSQPEDARHAIIEAVADLRDIRSIPLLIRLLEDRSPDIARSAHWALTVLARQDFGTLGAAWDEWWRHNRERHRIEWLIDALMHENQEIRRNAGDELKTLTKEYFGYYDDLPRKERQRAQLRYVEWWETKGKARFR